jgi:hypothetical protein
MFFATYVYFKKTLLVLYSLGYQKWYLSARSHYLMYFILRASTCISILSFLKSAGLNTHLPHPNPRYLSLHCTVYCKTALYPVRSMNESSTIKQYNILKWIKFVHTILTEKALKY